jgi:hypothetical protein
MGEENLISVELRFRSTDDPDRLGDRIRESVAMIVGRESLEDFRVRVLPLTPPKQRLRPVD